VEVLTAQSTMRQVFSFSGLPGDPRGFTPSSMSHREARDLVAIERDVHAAFERALRERGDAA
jgi:hypothetical protein